MRMLPKNRPPVHPGEMLLEEFIKPLGISQSEFARKTGISFPRLSEIIHERRGVTVDTALRFSQVLGTTPGFWMNMQQDWDLWHAMRSPEAKAISKLGRIHATA